MGLGTPLTRRYFGGGVAAFSPASLSPTAWYDPSDMSTLFQDSAGTVPVTATGQPVGRMLDKSGNGSHLIQATTAFKPAYTVSGALQFLQFDGIDDTMATAAALAYAQPWDRIAAWNQPTLAAGAHLCGAGGGIGSIQQNTASTIAIFDGFLPILAMTHPGAAVPFVFTERHSSPTNSRIAADNGAYTTGDSGTTTMANPFHIGSVGSNFANVQCHGMVMITRAMTDPEIANLRTYMAAKQGRTL